MKRPSQLSDRNAELLGAIRQQLEQEPLCLELRQYDDPEDADENILHILVIMQRELTQRERQHWVETLNNLAAEYNMRLQILLSSPQVWQDLKKLVGPFGRIEREGHTVWARSERI